MEFIRRDAPYVTPATSVQSVMLHVLLSFVFGGATPRPCCPT